MPPRKEPCRNFQRGLCQYGERCKFLHVNQQQAKPNPFGFGAQNTSQPQKPNPFGFGSQSASQPQKPNAFGFGSQSASQPQKPNAFGFGAQSNSQTGSKANQFKPGENKWSRFSPINNGSSAPQKQDNQSSAPNHECADSESCKRQISEDFEHEKPLWKLTCYGHRKYGPCDIIGDVSCEELRASAYDDAKHGMAIQTIVEKERSLLSSKLIEFENLLRNPYTPPQNSTLSTQNTLPGTTTNIFPQTIQNSSPPMVSSFSQLSTNFNSGFQMRPAAPNNAFGQVNQFQAPTQISNTSLNNSFAFGNPGQMGSQPSTQSFGGTFPATTTPFGNAFSTPATSPNLGLASQQPSVPFGGGPGVQSNPSANVVSEPVPSVQPKMPQNISNSNSNGDNSIWYKDEWRAGEIPEEAPPESVIY